MRITIKRHEGFEDADSISISPLVGDIAFQRFVDPGNLEFVGKEEEMFNLASGLFIFEALLRDGTYDGFAYDLNGSETIVIEMDYLSAGLIPLLESYLKLLLTFVLGESIKVQLVSGRKDEQSRLFENERSEGAICLFSGGVDSFGGIVSAKQIFQNTIGAFISHTMLRKLVEEKLAPFLMSKGISVKTIKIARGGEKIQQLRGFVYMAIAGVLCHYYNVSNIVVSEIGPVMFQPAYDVLDEVTVTTHPLTLDLSRKLVETYLGMKVNVITPFGEMTKAETAAFVSNYGELRSTNSCRTTRYANSQHPHCGRCLGCIIRRVSLLVAGVDDGDKGEYAWDVFVKDFDEPVEGRGKGWRIGNTAFSDLYPILSFADSALKNKIRSVSATKIDDYNLRGLFYRFATDVAAAAYILYDKSEVGRNRMVKEFYNSWKTERLVTIEMLESRIQDVREQRFVPNYEPNRFF